MINSISYQFPNHIQANRFLNELSHWSEHEVKAKLYERRDKVRVSYELTSNSFDYTASDLDDLANKYEGFEN